MNAAFGCWGVINLKDNLVNFKIEIDSLLSIPLSEENRVVS
jgi:hypothetical protein